MNRILHVDDDDKLRENTKVVLGRHKFIVDSAANAEEAIRLTDTTQYSVILLDIMMPGLDGFYILKTLRATGNLAGIFMLTGQAGEAEKVLALNSGADDYITKPYLINELIARIQRWIQRNGLILDAAATNRVLEIGELRLEVKKHLAWRAGKLIKLTSKQSSILFLLMSNPNKVFTPFEILEAVWNEDYDGLANTVEFHIKNLRQLIDGGSRVKFITTVRGSGYMFEEPAQNLKPR